MTILSSGKKVTDKFIFSIVYYLRERRIGISGSGIQSEPNSMEYPVLQVGAAFRDSLGADTSDAVRKEGAHIGGSPLTTPKATLKDGKGLGHALSSKTSVRKKKTCQGCHSEFS